MKVASLLALAAGFSAAADTTYVISVSNRVTEVQPSATVEVWAVFEPDLYAFAGARFDFHAQPDIGGLSDPACILDGPGTFEGDVSPDGDSVSSITAGQLFSPVGPPLDTSNPVPIWRVKWSTEVFLPREVFLSTATTKFDVYINNQGVSDQFLDQLVEGSGLIEVGCYADCDGSGSLDVFDYLCFINLFEADQAGADCDGSAGLDLFDFLCYVNRFSAGC